jgi:uncharacterized membrane protein YjjP (DUF1212 family)
MEIHYETIKESGNVLIRFGEAAVIGGIATFFVTDFPRWASLTALIGGSILLLLGLYLINKSHLEAQLEE